MILGRFFVELSLVFCEQINMPPHCDAGLEQQVQQALRLHGGLPLFLQPLDTRLQASYALIHCFKALKFHSTL
jgi:hypothetical protein